MAEFGQYREINSKLNKRFNLLRKPNLREGSESFRRLSSELSPFADYSGYCLYSAAKCDHQVVESLRDQLQLTSNVTGSPLSKSNIRLDRLLHCSLLAEFQCWLDTARALNRGPDDQINACISAYAHAVHTCPSQPMLTVVLCEFASLFKRLQRYEEAGEIYIEAGLFREASDCFLWGQHFEEAYHCYKELFRQQATFDYNYFDMDLSRVTQKTDKSPAKSSLTASLNLMSFFTRKTPEKGQLKSKTPTDESGKEEKKGCHFLSNCHLTIDDYITVFLLRLYLYDPVKYEYPCPIIPIPEEISNSRSEEDSLCEDTESFDPSVSEQGEGKQECPPHTLHYTLPFVDFINSCRTERSIADIVEVNLLLETLYLSFRNELKHTIDNEHMESGGEAEKEEAGDIREAVREETRRDVPARVWREDSKESTTTDDEHHHSASHKSIDNDLDDVSFRLQRLAARFSDNPTGPDESEVAGSGNEKVDSSWRRQCSFILSNEDRLRKGIAQKLYPLLTHQQNQLLYVIVSNKK